MIFNEARSPLTTSSLLLNTHGPHSAHPLLFPTAVLFRKRMDSMDVDYDHSMDYESDYDVRIDLYMVVLI